MTYLLIEPTLFSRLLDTQLHIRCPFAAFPSAHFEMVCLLLWQLTIPEEERGCYDFLQSDSHHPWRPQGTSLEMDEHVFPASLLPCFPASLPLHFLPCFRHSVSGDDWRAAQDEWQAGSGRERGPHFLPDPVCRSPYAAFQSSPVTECLGQATTLYHFLTFVLPCFHIFALPIFTASPLACFPTSPLPCFPDFLLRWACFLTSQLPPTLLLPFFPLSLFPAPLHPCFPLFLAFPFPCFPSSLLSFFPAFPLL